MIGFIFALVFTAVLIAAFIRSLQAQHPAAVLFAMILVLWLIFSLFYSAVDEKVEVKVLSSNVNEDGTIKTLRLEDDEVVTLTDAAQVKYDVRVYYTRMRNLWCVWISGPNVYEPLRD
jgi:predicted tellurium resistance membrane protein TerC